MRTLLDEREDRSRSGSRSRSISRVSTNIDRIRCYRYREYDHIAIECQNTATDEELDHIEQAARMQKARMAPPHFC